MVREDTLPISKGCLFESLCRSLEGLFHINVLLKLYYLFVQKRSKISKKWVDLRHRSANNTQDLYLILRRLEYSICRYVGAVIAQWIRLHLQSGSLGFESQAHHLGFSIYSQIIYYICHFVAKRTKINNRDPVWPILGPY